MSHDKGFTITELIIVVVLLGVIAAFGLPSYTKARKKADEKDGKHNLELIASAMDNYYVRNNGYPPANLAQVGDINTELKLGLIEQRMDYGCVSNVNGYTCTAVNTQDGWTLAISDTYDGNPRCSVGPCPSCAAGGC